MARVAIVTGASSGVGRAVAEDLLVDGWRTVLVARRPDRLAEVAADRDDALVLAGDVADPALAARAVELAGVTPGDELVVVAAAGVSGPIGAMGAVDLAAWRECLDVNLFGAVALSEAAMPALALATRGRLVLVSSAQSLFPPEPLVAAYGTTKSALNFYARCAAVQLAGTASAAVAVHPGDARTEIWDSIGDQAMRLGAEGELLRTAVDRIRRTGGDPLSKAVDLVRRVIDAPAEEVNGRFLFIEDGITAPIDPGW